MALVTATASTLANVDPIYNITCKPGQMVISMDATKNAPGVAFLCQASKATRSYERYKLKQDAVTQEGRRLGLLGEVLWFFGEYFDDANKVKRYQNKAEDRFEDARDYVKKGDDYAAKAQKAKSSSDRNKYRKLANEYYDKSVAARKDGEAYVVKIRDLVKKLGNDAPPRTQVYLVQSGAK